MRFSFAWVKQILGINHLVGTPCQWPCGGTIINARFAPIPICTTCFRSAFNHTGCEHPERDVTAGRCLHSELIDRWRDEFQLWVDSQRMAEAPDGEMKSVDSVYMEELIAEERAAVLRLQCQVGIAVERRKEAPIPELMAGVCSHLLTEGTFERLQREMEENIKRSRTVLKSEGES